MVSSQGKSYEGLYHLCKEKDISGLSWDITIQDRIINLLIKSDITPNLGAKGRRAA